MSYKTNTQPTYTTRNKATESLNTILNDALLNPAYQTNKPYLNQGQYCPHCGGQYGIGGLADLMQRNFGQGGPMFGGYLPGRYGMPPSTYGGSRGYSGGGKGGAGYAGGGAGSGSGGASGGGK